MVYRAFSVVVAVGVLASLSSSAAPEEVGTEALQKPSSPYLISLRKESIPVRRKGKVVSYKSSYSGAITLGSPVAQEFRVVFDTGSGQLIIPALQCTAEPCLKHRRYNVSASSTARPVNADGSPIDANGVGDSATIGFGTGQVTGELISEQVCVGVGVQSVTSEAEEVARDNTQSSNLLRRGNGILAAPRQHDRAAQQPPCTEVHMVAATDMTQNPFSLFSFDGVVGLGLSTLSLSANFSLFGQLVQSGRLAEPHMGFYVGGAKEEGDGVVEAAGELAVGGHNAARRNGPLSWVSVARPELGFWQVEIEALYVGGERLDACADGTCHGVVDTGTSHIGMPKEYKGLVDAFLSREPGSAEDCRTVEGPLFQIGLRGMNLTLRPESYMRQLPLAEGTRMGAGVGVSKDDAAAAAPASQSATASAGDTKVKTWCRPKLTPVSMPAPLGPNLFILGEPVLHAFYTVFDWSESHPRIGFSPAAKS